MNFNIFSTYLQKLELTSSRNIMTEILAELFKKADIYEIEKICYLLQGRVVPLFEAVEFGMAEKMVIKAIAKGVGREGEEINNEFKKSGDLGKTTEENKLKIIQEQERTGKTAKNNNFKPATIIEVYDILKEIAKSSGKGSTEIKINLLAKLVKQLDPLSSRYVVRIPISKMRLGFSEMTILDALSWMLSKDKSERKEIERAYNVRPDLGYLAKTIKIEGIKGLLNVRPVVGTPILMARAERLSSGEEIIEKIGRCGVEAKIDGFRLQIHYKKIGFVKKKTTSSKQQGFDFIPNDTGIQKVRLFTRNLEEVTFMYPDIVAGIERQIVGEEVIFEGEAIAFNPNTGDYLPFQETVQRKRKYDIEKMTESVPLKLICFDVLYKDGEDILNKSYKERRKELEKMFKKGEVITFSEQEEVENSKGLEEIFQKSITKNLEGIMAKKLDGVYQAGMRGWNWIKYKKSYDSKIDDTIDAVVMGFDFGQGKRTGFGIGAFLIGVYDKSFDGFKTIAKIGTGLTDDEWKTLKAKSKELETKNKPNRYEVDKMMECNRWIDPKIMVIIKADEITRSPVHTAGREMQKTKGGGGMEVKIPGYALRFPRLVSFRKDKLPEEATSVEEIKAMYKLQF